MKALLCREYRELLPNMATALGIAVAAPGAAPAFRA